MHVRRIKEHMVVPGGEHLAYNGLRHDITGSEVAAPVIAGHESFTLHVDQPSPFSAHGFGNQRTGLIPVVQRSRMELHELHIGDPHARTLGHGNARTDGPGAVGGMQIHLTYPACGQHG